MAPSLSSTPTNPSRGSLDAPPLPPILPIDIVEEIICRFPVKFLLQLRCVCKSWNSLISDPKFARRHLRRSNRRNLLVCSSNKDFMSYPLPSVLKHDVMITGATQLDNPLKYGNRDYSIIGSCDGIICGYSFIVEYYHSFFAWNPSIRKIWELTPLEIYRFLPEDDQLYPYSHQLHGFGYDNLSHRFKLVVIVWYTCQQLLIDIEYKSHVMIHTLGSNSWRRIGDFPGSPDWHRCGKLVGGALNWLAHDTQGIISLDLGKESWQEFLQPDYGREVHMLNLDVMRDRLCILVHYTDYTAASYSNWDSLNWDSDVWVMKEYGNNESWTKFFSFSHNSSIVRDLYNPIIGALYVCDDDDGILFNSYPNLSIYNCKTNTVRRLFDLENKPAQPVYGMYVEIESLISPCPQN